MFKITINIENDKIVSMFEPYRLVCGIIEKTRGVAPCYRVKALQAKKSSLGRLSKAIMLKKEK